MLGPNVKLTLSETASCGVTLDAQQMYGVSIVKAAGEYMLISHGPMLPTLISHVELWWLMRLKHASLVYIV